MVKKPSFKVPGDAKSLFVSKALVQRILYRRSIADGNRASLIRCDLRSHPRNWKDSSAHEIPEPCRIGQDKLGPKSLLAKHTDAKPVLPAKNRGTRFRGPPREIETTSPGFSYGGGAPLTFV